MICKNCGSSVDETYSYCPKCGIKNIRETYKVVVEKANAESLDVLRIIMQTLNCSPSDAKILINNIPFTIKETENLEEATEIKNKLESTGINASIQNVKKTITLQTNHQTNENKNVYQTSGSSNKPKIKEQSKKIEVPEQKTEKKNPFKTFWNTIEILIAAVVICVFIFGKPYVIGADFLAFLTGDDYTDNPYLEMVLNHRPFNNGSTYYGAFTTTFDRNEWHYFKADGKRIVQVTSYYADIDEEMITQFLVTPSENGKEFLIEPYAMRLSGQDLSRNEMNIVLGAVFSGDILEALGELIFYESLFY